MDLAKISELFSNMFQYITIFVKMIFQSNTWLNRVEDGLYDNEDNTAVYDVTGVLDSIEIEVPTTAE